MATSSSIIDEFIHSSKLMLDSKLNLLLIFSPLASPSIFGEATSFCFAGLALIPCAERLSMITEHIAEHSNETFGALINATFGNAPEFLISAAALRLGLYRIVQLTLLGSILTNLLFVFGLSCLIGGFRWQVQELRIISGNVSIGMLLLSTIGLLLPTILKNYTSPDTDIDTNTQIAFSRFNSVVMMVGYFFYLVFQLGTHKAEFDYTGNDYALFGGGHNIVRTQTYRKGTKKQQPRRTIFCYKACLCLRCCPGNSNGEEQKYSQIELKEEVSESTISDISSDDRLRRKSIPQSQLTDKFFKVKSNNKLETSNNENQDSAFMVKNKTTSEIELSCDDTNSSDEKSDTQNRVMSMRMGIGWLWVTTFVISLLSNVVVETIDGFAKKSSMSQIFTSVIIIPYFNNFAEQMSAVIFASKNQMDLCFGVTVGSAIQVALFVFPGCVLMGWWIDKPLVLIFTVYEMTCLLLAVLFIAALLQGGSTNWLVGMVLICIYLICAAGFWFHENEEIFTGNDTPI